MAKFAGLVDRGSQVDRVVEERVREFCDALEKEELDFTGNFTVLVNFIVGVVDAFDVDLIEGCDELCAAVQDCAKRKSADRKSRLN